MLTFLCARIVACVARPPHAGGPTRTTNAAHEREPQVAVETKKITKVLVANRGEIAVRVIRAAAESRG